MEAGRPRSPRTGFRALWCGGGHWCWCPGLLANPFAFVCVNSAPLQVSPPDPEEQTSLHYSPFSARPPEIPGFTFQLCCQKSKLFFMPLC